MFAPVSQPRFTVPMKGKFQKPTLFPSARTFADAGVDELSVADTIGMASPNESYSLFKTLKAELPDILVAAHFHDTRKMALANIYAALRAGIDRFDSASPAGLAAVPSLQALLEMWRRKMLSICLIGWELNHALT